MKNIFRTLDIKKIQLTRLEKIADTLFSLSFVAVIAFLGLIFYNQFLPIYNFDAFKSPKIINKASASLKEEKLNNIIKDLADRKDKTENYFLDKSFADPFSSAR